MGVHEVLAHETLLDGDCILMQGHPESHQLGVAPKQGQHEQLEVVRRQHLHCKILCAFCNGSAKMVVLLECFCSFKGTACICPVGDGWNVIHVSSMLQHSIPELLPATDADLQPFLWSLTLNPAILHSQASISFADEKLCRLVEFQTGIKESFNFR